MFNCVAARKGGREVIDQTGSVESEAILVRLGVQGAMSLASGFKHCHQCVGVDNV